MNLLFWLIPPLVGAVIGYVTNAIAIKMLFRPHHALRIFGFRLPFTPGILPRRRHTLADSIGAMVQRELLTPEIVKARLHREDVREQIRAAVGEYTGRLFLLPLGRISQDTHGLMVYFTGGLRRFIGTPAFAAMLERFLSSLADHLLEGDPRNPGLYDLSLRDILGTEETEKVTNILRRIILKGLDSAARDLPERLAPAFDRAFPLLIGALFRFLRQREIHGTLETQGRIFLHNAILKLNVVQRFFISAAQYDKTLRERMPEIVDDLLDQLTELLDAHEIRERIRSFIMASIQGFLLTPGTAEELAGIITDLFSPCLDKPLRALQGDMDRDALEKLIRRGMDLWGGGALETGLVLSARNFIQTHRDMTVGDFLAMEPDRKAALDELLCEKILFFAESRIEGLLHTLNVRTLVSERIDSLDMIEVEHIVLDVMANQLKWINLFGGILGALLGLVQCLLSLVTGASWER
jgi:uncharacterized membrane-anchored protein YjiN (DUF445 family)